MLNFKKVTQPSIGIKCCMVVLAFLLTFKLSAQTDSIRCMSFTFSNDAVNRTNRYYTSGTSFSYMDYRFENSFLKSIMIQLRNPTYAYCGVGLAQNVYTPDNPKSTVYNYADRPYTATLCLSAFYITNSRKKRIRITSSAQIGVIGSYAWGKELQDQFNLGRAPNWANQLTNAPIVNYSITYEKGYVSNKMFELIGKSQAEVGTLYINAKGGVKIRTGIIRPYFIKHEESNGKLQMYFESENFMKLMPYDATLTGSYLSENKDALPKSSIKNIVYEGHFSAVLSNKKVRLCISQHISSPEFLNAYWNLWMSLKFGYALN